MFSTLSPVSHNTFPSPYYAPVTPSPLSSSPLRLSPNGDANFNMSSPSSPQKEQAQRYNDSIYSSRQTKKNPLIHRNDNENGRETRRKLFLRRVRQDSEDKRWERRGGDDEIMRTIWIAEQNRREERRAREARAYAGTEEDEDLEDVQSSEIGKKNSTRDEEMVDEVAQQEDDEMEAMLSMLDSKAWDPPPAETRHNEDNNTLYGSDDDEYDQLFKEMEFGEVGGNLASHSVQCGNGVDLDMMDVS